jgi:hypothetical protein
VEIRAVTHPVCYGPSGGIDVLGHLRCEIVDGHRYADDPEPSWYSGSQYARPAEPQAPGPEAFGSHTTGSLYDSGIHERPSGAFRLPEQRPAVGGYPLTDPDPVTSTGSHARPAGTEMPPPFDPVRVPVRGTEYPTVRPTGASPATEPAAEPTSLVPPVAPMAPPSFERPAEAVYSTRRPVSSFAVAIVMAILLIPVVRLLLHASFSGTPTPAGVVPAVLLALGFTLTGIGLFAVASGRPLSRDTWLRPPVAYLPAGLLLLLAAGLAVA